MDFNIFTTPAQINLLNDLLFDLTGTDITISELTMIAVATAAVHLFLKSPKFNTDM